MSIATCHVAIDLCEALNLDPKKVIELHLHVVRDSVITIDTIQYVYSEEINNFIKVLKRYELHEKNNEDKKS